MYVIMECTDSTDCVNIYEKGQKHSSGHSSTELSKTRFFPVSIVKNDEKAFYLMLKAPFVLKTFKFLS